MNYKELSTTLLYINETNKNTIMSFLETISLENTCINTYLENMIVTDVDDKLNYKSVFKKSQEEIKNIDFSVKKQNEIIEKINRYNNVFSDKDSFKLEKLKDILENIYSKILEINIKKEEEIIDLPLNLIFSILTNKIKFCVNNSYKKTTLPKIKMEYDNRKKLFYINIFDKNPSLCISLKYIPIDDLPEIRIKNLEKTIEVISVTGGKYFLKKNTLSGNEFKICFDLNREKKN